MWRMSETTLAGTEALPDSKAAGAVAVTASSAALACGVCCVLPFALPAAMLTSLGGVFAWFADVYRWMVPLAVLAVAAGWLWVGWQSWSIKRQPARRTLVVMAFATAMMVLALLWPAFEPFILQLVRR
jgi:cytochrome bd-type quinol oxidase subunit 1